MQSRGKDSDHDSRDQCVLSPCVSSNRGEQLINVVHVDDSGHVLHVFLLGCLLVGCEDCNYLSFYSLQNMEVKRLIVQKSAKIHLLYSPNCWNMVAVISLGILFLLL